MPDHSLIKLTDLGFGSASFREADIGAAAANSHFVPHLGHSNYAQRMSAFPVFPLTKSASENFCNRMLTGCVLKLVFKHSFAITVLAPVTQNTVFNTAIQRT